MSGNLKSYIYKELKVQDSDIKKIIKSFSAYLDEFDKDFKYNYKFLVSHIEDFEISNLVHNIFKNQCSMVIKALLNERLINNFLKKILIFNDRMSCNIDFNNALQYPVRDFRNGEDPWRKNGTLPKWTWDRIKEKNCVKLNISIDYRYDNLHFSRRFFNVNTDKNEYISLVQNFFNDSCHSLIIEKISEINYQKLKTLRLSLPDEYSIKVVIDDLQSLMISRSIENNFLADDVMILENNANLNSGTVFISANGRENKFSSEKLKDIEAIKDKLMTIYVSDMEEQ